MANVRLGSIVDDIRGSIAGVTYSRNRAGIYTRARIKPINRKTPRQTVVRTILATLQHAYQTVLDAGQRAAWLELAAREKGNSKLGDNIKLTAQTLFIKANAVLLLCGGAIAEDPPIPSVSGSLPTLTITGTTATGIMLAVPSPAPAAGDALAFDISNAQRPVINFYKGPWPRYLWHLGAIAAPLELVDKADLLIGQRWFIRARWCDATGHIAPESYTQVDIAA
jgi:hypothetical protein